jgi:hypothetical protein
MHGGYFHVLKFTFKSVVREVVPVHVMNAYRGIRGNLHIFLISALDGDGRSAHASSALAPRVKTSCTHSAGGWMGLRAHLDVSET